MGEREGRRNWQAGVDEAGLGPILGPLVVSGVALGGPAGADPWRRLRDTVSRERTEKGKVRVADSKKVNQGEHGVERLEATALAFVGAWRGTVPSTLADLLAVLGANTRLLAAYPWYQPLTSTLPLHADPGLIELQAHRLARALRREGFAVEHLTAAVVDAVEFNALIEKTRNKSRTHFRVYTRVMAELLSVLPDGAHIVADRCGGLVHYARALRRSFPRARVEVLGEHPQESRYEIANQDKRVRATFAVQGEDRAFPTALASCFAKYVRELLVDRVNRWFCARLPGLAPTAGYWTDGHRFAAQVEPVLAAASLPRSLLVRAR